MISKTTIFEELAPETQVTLPKTVTLERITPVGEESHFIVRWSDGISSDFKIFTLETNEDLTLLNAKEFARQLRNGFIPMRKTEQIEF